MLPLVYQNSLKCPSLSRAKLTHQGIFLRVNFFNVERLGKLWTLVLPFVSVLQTCFFDGILNLFSLLAKIVPKKRHWNKKYITSSTAAAAAGAAPPAAAAAGAAPAPDPTLATRSLMLTDSRHLAKRPGQKGSTVTLAAFKMVLIFSA